MIRGLDAASMMAAGLFLFGLMIFLGWLFDWGEKE